MYNVHTWQVRFSNDEKQIVYDVFNNASDVGLVKTVGLTPCPSFHAHDMYKNMSVYIYIYIYIYIYSGDIYMCIFTYLAINIHICYTCPHTYPHTHIQSHKATS